MANAMKHLKNYHLNYKHLLLYTKNSINLLWRKIPTCTWYLEECLYASMYMCVDVSGFLNNTYVLVGILLQKGFMLGNDFIFVNSVKDI